MITWLLQYIYYCQNSLWHCSLQAAIIDILLMKLCFGMTMLWKFSKSVHFFTWQPIVTFDLHNILTARIPSTWLHSWKTPAFSVQFMLNYRHEPHRGKTGWYKVVVLLSRFLSEGGESRCVDWYYPSNQVIPEVGLHTSGGFLYQWRVSVPPI